jgi:hypothetical protein
METGLLRSASASGDPMSGGAGHDADVGWAIAASGQLLARYASQGAARADRAWIDAGPPILGSVVLALDPNLGSTVDSALARWLDDVQEHASHAGLFGGLAGLLVGLHIASEREPRYRRVEIAAIDALASWCRNHPWRTRHVAWEDYDLVSGPSGVALAMLFVNADEGSGLGDCLSHLSGFANAADLSALAVTGYATDPDRSWNEGLVNLGMAHGVTGVIATLAHAERVRPRTMTESALGVMVNWLMERSGIDDGLVSWPPGSAPRNRSGLGRTGRRQAWCYGTPGVAGSLLAAGNALNDQRVQGIASNAFRTFCERFQPNRYLDPAPLDGRFGFCHGAAGTLAIADTFARARVLPESITLRQRLADFIADERDPIIALGATDMTLLNGASGILATYLASAGGRRDWMGPLGLS